MPAGGRRAPAFLKDFGEDVVYTPSGGTPRTIKADVDRNPPAGIAEAPQGGVAPVAIVEVANRQSSTTTDTDGVGGISSSELNCGGDTLTLARRVGQTATARPITRLVGHDAGMLKLEVRCR